MLKLFNFGIFFIALSIVSVTHALSDEIEKMIRSQSFKNPNNAGKPTPSYTEFSTNLLKSFPSGSSATNKNPRSFTKADADAFELGIMKIKGKESISDRTSPTGSVIIKCWVNGQSRILQKGETCNGTIQVVNVKDTSQYTSQPLPTSENNVKPQLSSQYGLRRPFSSLSLPSSTSDSSTKSPLSNQDYFTSPYAGGSRVPSLSQKSLGSPLSSQNNVNLPLPKKDDLDLNLFNKFTPEKANTVPNFIEKDKAIAPINTKDPEDYSHLKSLFDDSSTSDPTEMTPVSQNYPPLPMGTKHYTLPDGRVVMAAMPQEIAVENHSYEPALGLKDEEVREIRNQVLERTNFYRQKYGFNKLTLNENMNNHAQEWANKLAPLKRLKQRSAQENDLYGENLYASSPLDKIGEEAVNTWYNELRFIKEKDGEEELHNNPNNIGHLIQLLWKASKEMGVGVAKGNDDEYFIVVDYNPKGDIYPFLKDNLPEFKQSDIDAAERAHQTSPGEVQVLSHDDNHLREPVTHLVTENSDPNDYYKTIRVPKHDYVKPLRLSDSEVAEIREDVLNKSNMYRQRYGIEPLVLNNQISNYSQEWANYLALNNKFEHRPNDGTRIYGENLHKSQKLLHVGEVAVDLWYYEVGLVKVDDDDEKLYANDGAGHLTQLLWKASKQMGCGAAVNGEGKVIVVANYNPSGNVRLLYLNNLPRFTQEQINEGKSLQKVIKDLQNKDRVMPPPGVLESLPGWKSALYN